MSYTFNLDVAIASWRQSLKLNRSFSGDDLDELENHLRDAVESSIQEGMAEEDAYRDAMSRLGNFTDLEPEFNKVRLGSGRIKTSMKTDLKWFWAMARNYTLTSFRYMRKHPVFSSINVGGLAVGLAGCLLMVLFVRQELSFDKGIHSKEDRIYRLGSSTVGWPYGKILEAEYPEVERVTYMRSYPTFPIKHQDQTLYETLFYADNAFFDVFDYDFVSGSPQGALETAYSIVLSSELSERLFGTQDAAGRQLVLRDSLQFSVTGVVNVPKNSHIQFSGLMSLETFRAFDPERFDDGMTTQGWLDVNMINYLVLNEGVDVAAFKEKVRTLPMDRVGELMKQWGIEYELGLEKYGDIYLKSDQGNLLGPSGSLGNVYLLGAVGLFLLLIACVNFINLTTARASTRAREIGLRKAIGADRTTLAVQFLFDSALAAFGATLLSMGIARLALPLFNSLVQRSYTAQDLVSLEMFGMLMAIFACVTLVSGAYPALLLSGYHPVEAMKGPSTTKSGGGWLRKGLVGFQFTTSGVLIVVTLVAYTQIRYMQSRPLGFDAEQVVVVDARKVPGAERNARYEAFEQSIKENASVSNVSSMWTVPGRSGWRGQLSFPEGYPNDGSYGLEYLAVGWDVVPTLGINVIAGRAFDRQIGQDASTAVLINEEAVKAAGWASSEEAVGKRFTSPGSGKPEGVVIGVFENYHHHGLQESIEPMMMGISPSNGLFAIRVESAQMAGVVSHIAGVWDQFFPGYTYETFFMDDDFALQYQEEQRLTRVLSIFAILTILIACLGLSGLTAFATAQRTKEIGIRKTMGASSRQVVMLLSGDSMRPIFVSFIIASAISYFISYKWVERFAYRTDIGIELLALAGVIMLMIAFLTVSFQSVRAAMADPVKSIRYQ